MKHKNCILKFVVGLGLIPAFSYARTVSDPRPYRLLDQLAAVAATGGVDGTLALELLKRVALGRMPDLPTESLNKLGLAPTPPLGKLVFVDAYFRTHAFENIGKIDQEAAFSFLANVIESDLGLDTTGTVWTSSQIALANARLNKISGQRMKIEFLESLVTDRSLASFWAVNQLCDGGSLGSISVTRLYFKQTSRSEIEYGEEQRRFCERRMEVVFGKTNRVEALGSVLSVEKNSPDADKLVQWAVEQLIEMNNPAANAELKRFQKDIEKIAKDNFRYSHFSNLNESIEGLLEHNRLRTIGTQVKGGNK